MFGVERRSIIMTILNEKKSILVNEVASQFGVVEETIRRDLKELEAQGLLVRTHGGAVLTEDSKSEAPLEIREGINITGKNSIALQAANLIADGDTIILDASTSALFVAKHIKEKKGLTVITNAVKVVLELADCGDITVVSTGGVLRHNSLSYVGRAAENLLDNYHAGKLFFSCKGISLNRGLTDSNEQESDLRRKMIASSDKVIFLCDHTKFDRVGYVTTAKLEDMDLMITDRDLSGEWADRIRKADIEVVIAR